MSEKPILFNGEMVRAILDGRKTQTRRPCVPQVIIAIGRIPGPPYAVGDRLWVREAWGLADMWLMPKVALAEFYDDDDSAAYTGKVPGHYEIEDLAEHVVYRVSHDREFFWRPSIHMPRWASRITLEVTEVRVERAQEISEKNAADEGCRTTWRDYPERNVERFAAQWDAIYAKRGLGWDVNPWVFVYTFKRLT